MIEEGDVHGEGGEDETKAAVEESWAQLLMHTDGLQSVKALSPSHSSIFVHQVHTRPSAFPSSASLAVTGEPGGFAPPAPLKILIPGFSSSLSSPYTLHLSSNQPIGSLAHSAARSLKVWGKGRGARVLARLPAILLFWEGGVLFLLLSVILTLSLVTVLPPPLLSWVQERQSEREERVAQPQFEVSSLSLLSRIVVIYPPAWRFPFTFASLPRVFGSAEGTPQLFPSSLFFFSFWLCGEEHLCMRVTADERGCGYQRLPAAATTPWAADLKHCR